MRDLWTLMEEERAAREVGPVTAERLDVMRQMGLGVEHQARGSSGLFEGDYAMIDQEEYERARSRSPARE